MSNPATINAANGSVLNIRHHSVWLTIWVSLLAVCAAVLAACAVVNLLRDFRNEAAILSLERQARQTQAIIVGAGLATKADWEGE